MTAALRPGNGARAAPASGRRQVSTARGFDAVAALTVWIVLVVAVPAPLIVKPLGGEGTPANILGVIFLLWWVCAKLGPGQGVDRGRQPVRIALLGLGIAITTSTVSLYMRAFVPKEASATNRGFFFLAAMSGVALLAADGISSIDRVHVLMRRLIHGITFVAGLAIVQFVTRYNPAQSLSIPGLTRNLVLEDQARLSFVRVQATALHPIELGAVLGLGLTLAVHYALLPGGLTSKRVAWAEVALIAVALPMALTRTGVVVAACGLFALFLDWSWRRRVAALSLGALAVGVFAFVIPKLVSAVTEMFTKITQDNSTTAREQRYGIAGHYFLQHPWFGRGFNSLYPATGQIFDNNYLAIATETGIVGIVAIAVLFAIAICTARGARLRSTDGASKGLAQAMAGCFVGTAVAFATSDVMTFQMAMGIFFLLFGTAGALWRLNGGARPSTSGWAEAAPARATVPTRFLTSSPS